MDFIITVCDQAAQKPCPFWPGQPVTAHWSFPDPSKVLGDESHKHKAFVDTLNGLRNRIETLAQMPLDKLDSMSLREVHTKA